MHVPSQIENEVTRCFFQAIQKKITLLNRNQYCLFSPSTILFLKFILHWGSVGNIKKGVDERVNVHTNVRNPLLFELLKAFVTDHKIMQVH